MKKFGRFEFGKEKPTEVYEGDYMTLDKGFVCIFKVKPDFFSLMGTPHLLNALHLDKGQSMREMSPSNK